MQVASAALSTQAVQSGPSPKAPTILAKVVDGVKAGIHFMDEYTSPRPNTHGNYEKASYFQATFQGGTEGLYLMGPAGILSGAGSALAGAVVQNKTGSQALGVATGMSVGAMVAAGVATVGGAPLATTMVLGGLLGAFQTIRCHGESKIRDAGGNATMVSAFFLPGPSKMAGGIGAAIGQRCESKVAKALVGAATGAAVGAGLAAIGFAPVGVAAAALGSGLAGAVGPFVGPRFSQFFRNLAEDLGDGVEKVLKRPMSPKVSNAIGAVPSSFIKEGIRGFMYSDGGLLGFVVGGIMESIQQAHIMLFSKDGDAQKAASETTPTVEQPRVAKDGAEAPSEKKAA